MEEGDEKEAISKPRHDFWRNPRPTNENPNFVHDYFASSRLHFIGSFRARYESMMVAVGKKLGVNPSELLQSSAQKGLLSSKSKPAERIIVHVDMDCFFASIAAKKDPSLKGKCIAVCHGGGEISSCSYEARKFGVRAGTFFRDARKLCPELLSVPYDFPLYEEVSIQIYARFYDYPGVCVEAVSVDEAYLDITLAVGDDREGSQTGAEALVQNLRNSIYAETGCTASAGIGPSRLIARLATKGAKPNGQLRIRQENVIQYLDTLEVRDLPGIGWRTTRRLDERGVTTCPQLRALSLSELQSEFGERQGQVFHDLARALDARPVEPLKPRKSIGAEASWGVRFEKDEGEKARKFIRDMADEVATRVIAAGAHGTKVTFKVYKKKPNSSMVGYKHLGHGPCTVLTRSAKIPSRSSGRSLRQCLREACLRLHEDLGVRNEELRGVGLQMTDLSFADLNFDYTAAPTSGETRRIDSFFEAAPSSLKPDLAASLEAEAFTSSKLEASLGEVAEVGTAGPQLTNGGNADGEGVISRQVTARPVDVDSEALNQEERASHADCRPRDVKKARLYDSGDEDRIEVGRAPEAPRRLPGSPDVLQHLDIPSGWDREVFVALPKELQTELLTENDNNNARTRVPASGEEIQQQDTLLPPRQENKRKRGPNSRRAALQAMAERRNRRKQSEQVTMTQFADISELRTRGHEMLDAEEFREKPLRDCVELLEDLRGKGLRTRTSSKDDRGLGVGGGVRTLNRVVWQSSEINANSRDDAGLDIPSPPSLSSDSDSSQGVSAALFREGLEHAQVYEDEDIVDYATKLKTWMDMNAEDIKSAHVELLRSRVLELLRMKKLERLCSELGMIGRFAEQYEAGGWRECFKGLVQDVQSESMQLYGFTLVIRKLEPEQT